MHNKGNYKQGVYFIFQIEIVIQLSAPGGYPSGLLYVAPTGFFQWEVPAGSQSEGRQKSDSHNVRQSWKDWGPSLGITAIPKHASQFLLARPPSLVRSKVGNNTYVVLSLWHLYKLPVYYQSFKKKFSSIYPTVESDSFLSREVNS